MKHIPQDKYNVAWFTLAECIARKEKVRALGVYRLLAHSIDDIAFRRQLEADILLAFQDDIAVAKYKEAAQLYRQGGRLLEAIAVYEHLRALEPEIIDHLESLIHLYETAKISSKTIVHVRALFQMMMQNQKLDAAADALKLLDSLVTPDQSVQEHQQLVFALIRDERPKYKVLEHLRAAVHGLMIADDMRALQKFLSTLEALDATYRNEANILLQKDS